MINEGQVAESGKHNELIKQQGLYFNLVKDNQWLGDFISMIRDSDISSPLYRLKDYLPEIEELNEYSKIYHHSNPNYLDVLINPTELSIHVRSTINLLYVL